MFEAGVAEGLRERLGRMPSAGLAVALEQASGRVPELDEDTLVELVAAAHRVAAWAGSVQLAGMAALLASRSQLPAGLAAAPENGPARQAAAELARRSTVAEVALATGTSEHAAATRLTAAIALDRRLPRTRGLYRCGAVDWPKVQAMVDATAGLPDEVAAAVESDVLPPPPAMPGDREGAADGAVPPAGQPVGGTVPALRKRLAASVARRDPQARPRCRAAVEDRRVVFTPVGDGMTELWALLPADRAAEAQARLKACARAAGGAGDPRTADQRRADVLLDLLTGTAPADGGHGAGCTARAPQILVLAGLGTLLGLDDEPGFLDGYGPLPAEMLREVAARGTWRCAVVDDRHGTLLGLGRATWSPEYRPGRLLARHVSVRDGTCTFPGCHRRAEGCDRDHRRRHPEGPTCECNLGLLCRHHHRLKHKAGFDVRVAEDDGSAPPGTVDWTTPTGRTYRRHGTGLLPPPHT